MTLLNRAGIPVHRIRDDHSNEQNEGGVKFYCERQTLQEKKWSQVLAAPGASSSVLVQQAENRNTTCQSNMFANTSSPKFVDFGNARFENCNFAFTYNVARGSDD